MRLGKSFVLKKYLAIRFTGVAKVFERIVKLWDCLEQFYIQHRGEDFFLNLHKNQIFQISGILNNLRDIQVHAQTESVPVACTTILHLVEFEIELAEERPLKIGRTTIPFEQMEPEVIQFRRNLLECMNKRFFNRYCSTPPSSRGSGAPADSMLLEMASVMHPAYKHLSFLSNVIERRSPESRPEHVSQVKKSIHRKVIELGISVARTMEIVATPTARCLEFDRQDDVDHLADQFDVLDVNIEDNVESIIMLEFEKYLREAGERSRDAQGNILAWWRARTEKYPHFSQVARCLLATEASSGSIELDFSLGGNFVTNQRLRLSNENIEMKLFITRNLSFLDWNSIVEIPADDLKVHMPSVPVIPFVESTADEDDDDE